MTAHIVLPTRETGALAGPRGPRPAEATRTMGPMTPAARPSEEDAAAAFLDASRVLVGITLRSIAAAPVPLTVPQHRVMLLVAAEGPRRVGALAEDLGVNQSNASRLVDRLVGQGLVERTRDSADRRASLVALTPAGRSTLAVVHEHRLAALRSVVARMPAQVRAAAPDVLRAFSAAAGAD